MRGRNEWDGAFHFQLPGLKKQQKQTNKKQNKTNLTIQIGSIHSEQKSSAGLRNPREHGSAAPRKNYGWQKKNQRILEKKKSSEKKKKGLRIMDLFLNMA